jgi:hypothetical protein
MVKSYYYIINDQSNNQSNNQNELIQYYKDKDLPIDASYLIIKMGQSDIENTKLVKDASQNDWWFHLAEFPSAHALTVFAISKDLADYDFVKDKNIKILMASLVKSHSKQKHLTNIKVHYCQRKNLQIGDKAGLVILTKTPLSLKLF